MKPGFAVRWIAGCVLIFLARGVALIGVLGPNEGWDEYQHLGYFEAVGRETLRLGRTGTPIEIYDSLKHWPAPTSMTQQFASGHVVDYHGFWNGARSQSTPGTMVLPPLYQAQHPPMYYVLHRPIYLQLGLEDWRSTVYVLRAVNLLWSAVAIAGFGWLLTELRVGSSVFAGTLLLLSLQPLWLMNAARVSNDALATATAFLGLACLVRGRGSVDWTLASACIINSAGWMKATAWTAPAVGLAYLLTLTGYRRLVSSTLFVGITALGLTGFLIDNYRRHDVWMPSQEMYHLSQAGKEMTAVSDAAWKIDWPREWRRRIGRELLWVGGWSFVRIPDAFGRIHEAALASVVVAGVWRLLRQKPILQPLPPSLVLATAAWLATAAVMSLHMAQTQAAFGFVGTPVWYASAAIPWLMLTMTGAFVGKGRTVIIAGVAALFLAAESFGWFSMIRQQTEAADVFTAWQRTALLHPDFASPLLAAVAWCVAWISAGYAFSRPCLWPIGRIVGENMRTNPPAVRKAIP